MRAARVDLTHAPIVALFRAFGWEVESLAACGKGVSDLLVFKSGIGRFLIECKSSDKVYRTPKLTRVRQAQFAERFPVVRLCSVAEAEAWVRGK